MSARFVVQAAGSGERRREHAKIEEASVTQKVVTCQPTHNNQPVKTKTAATQLKKIGLNTSFSEENSEQESYFYGYYFHSIDVTYSV
jgi:hypothetical protein